MSPLKSLVSPKKDSTQPNQRSHSRSIEATTKVIVSQRRLTRFAAAEGRKLDLDSDSIEPQKESEEERRRRELIDDCPSFDLGVFDNTRCEEKGATEAHDPAAEPVIISSNKDSGDSLDKIYATIAMPIRTPSTQKNQEVQEVTTSPTAPCSYTRVPQAHQKRVVKPGKDQQSPYADYGKKPVSSKTANELYNKITSYGGKLRTHSMVKRSSITVPSTYISVTSQMKLDQRLG